MLLKALALTAILALPGFGDRFIYYPTRAPASMNAVRDRIGAVDRAITAEDGTRLHSWWIERPGAKAALLYLHGNGGNLSNYAPLIERLSKRLDVSVLAIDYRGFGRSEGRPTESGLYRDAEAAFDELTGPLGFAPGQVVIFGLSLGTAVATELAVRRPLAAALVLEAPFTSMTEMVRRAVPFVEPESLVDARYDTLGKVARLAMPLAVIHGDRDVTIPYEMGKRVYEAAPSPKWFWGVGGGGHTNCSVVDPAFYDNVAEVIRRGLERRGKSAPRLF